jgi:crotonobetainyl-CoA:carnitine CoA-transferase CaiB-like acyl-CoA transferase
MGLLSDVTSVFVGRTPPMGPVPALGEHATVVLAELGVGTEEVDALRGQGVV